MRVLCCAFFALVLSAQVPAPVPPPKQPQWLMDLIKIRQEMHQAELGSLDAKVEQAWRSALATPQHPEFLAASQITWSFYQSQGYDLKAEQVLRQALAAAPKDDPRILRNLSSQLAIHFENTQQLVKALSIREEMAKDPPPATDGYNHEAVALANLYERMGEIEKAEAVWKEAAASRAAGSPQNDSRFVRTARRGFLLGGFGYAGGYRIGVPNELAGFYARRGRTAEAEQLYQKALDDAAQNNSSYEWNQAADNYIGFLSQERRFSEAIDLARQGIARLETFPDTQAAGMLLSKRQHLASLLMQAGRSDEALEMQKQTVELAQAQNPSGLEYVQALGSLAETLVSQNRLEEAEKAVARMREAGAADTRNGKFYEVMAVQVLARIRDLQKKPEEARQLRGSMGGDSMAANREKTVYEATASAQQAALQGDIDTAIATAGEALALAMERSRSNPQEVSGLMSLANVLMDKQKKEEARRIMIETLRILDRVPDHPRVADALGSVTSVLFRLGMAAEAERAAERQEKILLEAKGAESLALHSISHARIERMQRDGDWMGVMEERKRMLDRVEKMTGAKSRESLSALREVAWAYPQLNNWPEEERVLSTLLERTANLSGRSGVEYSHLLVQMANRASHNRQFEKALNWIDQAIEVARALPDADVHLPGIMQNRAQIAQAKEAPRGGPFYAPAGAASGAGRWFDTDRFRQSGPTVPNK